MVYAIKINKVGNKKVYSSATYEDLISFDEDADFNSNPSLVRGTASQAFCCNFGHSNNHIAKAVCDRVVQELDKCEELGSFRELSYYDVLVESTRHFDISIINKGNGEYTFVKVSDRFEDYVDRDDDLLRAEVFRLCWAKYHYLDGLVTDTDNLICDIARIICNELNGVSS